MQPLLVDYNSPNISDTKGGVRREADGDSWRHEEWVGSWRSWERDSAKRITNLWAKAEDTNLFLRYIMPYLIIGIKLLPLRQNYICWYFSFKFAYCTHHCTCVLGTGSGLGADGALKKALSSLLRGVFISSNKSAKKTKPARNSGGSNPGLGARGLEPFVDFCGREKGLEPLARGSSF
jgi:hypothetical protein